jgi:FkbM family methyltransferase
MTYLQEQTPWPKRAAQWALRKVGYDVFPTGFGGPMDLEDFRRTRLLESRGVTLVLDVGANIGQFARRLRAFGYEGRIESFEPLAEAFESLRSLATGDDRWRCRRLALGEEEGTVTINVSENSYSSSLLEIRERHVESDPQSRYVATEEVPITRLDSIWPELAGDEDVAFLKLDVQGLELDVLRGGDKSLSSIAAVQTELSLVPLYEGAPGYREVIDYLDSRGFALVGLEPGHWEPDTGQIVQVDGTFVRS